MRAIAVHLDARRGLDLAVGVSADVGAAVDHRDRASRSCGTLGDREAEEP